MSNPPIERWQEMLAVNPRLSAQLAKEANVTESQLPEFMASIMWEEASSRIKTALNTLLDIPPIFEDSARHLLRPAGFFCGAKGL